MLLDVLVLWEKFFLSCNKNLGHKFWCSALITKIAPISDNTLKAVPTVEEAILKIVQDTVTTNKGNDIVIYDSGFSQGGE